jgi:PAP2 superfamily.
MKNILQIILFILVFLQFSYQVIATEKIKTDSLHQPTKNKLLNVGSLTATGIIGAGVFLEFSKHKDHWYTSKYAFQDEVFKQIHDYTTVVDDYTQFAPLGISLGLIALNKSGKNKRMGQISRLLTSEIIGLTVMGKLKTTTKRRRPNGIAITSFPSGHTTQAFIGARFLDKEFGNNYPWLKYTGYILATLTGVSRIMIIGFRMYWLAQE